MDRLKARKLLWFSNKSLFCLLVTIISSIIWGCKKEAAPKLDEINITETEFSYDFGVVPDSINELSHCFVLINNTNDTCNIVNIEKSCGCTKIDIDNKIILPQDSIRINVLLELGSIYSFIEKDINIYTDKNSEPLTIYLRATREVPKIIIKKEFPFKLSENLRLSAHSALIGYVQHGQQKTCSVNILNTSNKTRHLKLKNKLPDGFDVIYPESIEPQEISRIVFLCELKKEIYGEISFDCFFEEEGKKEEPFRVYMIATEKFSRGNRTSPRVCVPITAYNANILKEKTNLTYNIVNIGSDTLKIRHLQCSNNNVTVESDKNICLPSDTCKIIVNVPHKEQPLKEDVIIGVVTNDNIEPYKQLRIVK